MTEPTMSGLGITSSYEEWLEEFILINSNPGRADGSKNTGLPTTRKEYYARYCDPDTDTKAIYEQHLAAASANRSRGAMTSDPDASD